MRNLLLVCILGFFSAHADAKNVWSLYWGFGLESTLSGPTPASLSLGVRYQSIVTLRYTYGSTYLNPAELVSLIMGGSCCDSTSIQNFQMRLRLYKWLHVHTGYSQYVFHKSILSPDADEDDIRSRHLREGVETGMSLDWEWQESGLSLSFVNYFKTHKARSSLQVEEGSSVQTIQEIADWDALHTKDFDPFFHSLTLSYYILIQ
jgi:hypothetical protein